MATPGENWIGIRNVLGEEEADRRYPDGGAEGRRILQNAANERKYANLPQERTGVFSTNTGSTPYAGTINFDGYDRQSLWTGQNSYDFSNTPELFEQALENYDSVVGSGDTSNKLYQALIQGANNYWAEKGFLLPDGSIDQKRAQDWVRRQYGQSGFTEGYRPVRRDDGSFGPDPAWQAQRDQEMRDANYASMMDRTRSLLEGMGYNPDDLDWDTYGTMGQEMARLWGEGGEVVPTKRYNQGVPVYEFNGEQITEDEYNDIIAQQNARRTGTARADVFNDQPFERYTNQGQDYYRLRNPYSGELGGTEGNRTYRGFSINEEEYQKIKELQDAYSAIGQAGPGTAPEYKTWNYGEWEENPLKALTIQQIGAAEVMGLTPREFWEKEVRDKEMFSGFGDRNWRDVAEEFYSKYGTDQHAEGYGNNYTEFYNAAQGIESDDSYARRTAGSRDLLYNYYRSLNPNFGQDAGESGGNNGGTAQDGANQGPTGAAQGGNAAMTQRDQSKVFYNKKKQEQEDSQRMGMQGNSKRKMPFGG